MNIVFLNMPIEYYSPTCGGAVSTIIMETSRELIARGHDVTVLTAVNGEPVHKVGNVVPIDARKGERLSLLERKISGLRQRIHRWDWPRYEYYREEFTAALSRLPSAPDAVIVFNDLVTQRFVEAICPDAARLVWLQNECRTNQRSPAASFEAVDTFLSCSAHIARWTQQTHGIPAEKFIVVHSGVNLQTFRPRDDYRAARSPIKAIFIGRIDPNKGPDLAADAVAKLRDEGLDVELTIAGGLWFYDHGNEMEDPYFRDLKTKAERAGAQLIGHVVRADVPALIREHDISFVLSRSNEPFGLVVLESMASGLAVIASNRGGLPEACGGAAMLVDPDDFGSIVKALRELVTSPQRLAEMKERAVERASRASWAGCAQAIEQTILSRREVNAAS